jgi:two-component system copper resistance phosphate regulon response regulator CusR
MSIRAKWCGFIPPEFAMRLLIVEDDPKTRTYLSKGLAEAGFVVDTADDGVSGLHLLRSGGYDLVVLDVMLPGMDGWGVIRELRQAGISTPTLFLTARDSTADLIRGLDLGADDYLAKPFVYAEFLARVRALLRRGSAHASDLLQVNDLKLDFHRHKSSRADRVLDLTPKEFALLALLMRHHGEVLSRTQIASQVWDINFDSDMNLVDVSLSRLRRKVDADTSLKLIHTVRGVGYVLEAR